MTKSTKKAPSTTGSDSVSGGSRSKNTKENTKKHQFNKALFGVIFLILKISFLIAIVTLMKMPQVHFMIDIPLYQIVGGIILSFLVYLELYAYFTKPAEKTNKKEVQPKTALSKFKLGYEDIAAK